MDRRTVIRRSAKGTRAVLGLVVVGVLAGALLYILPSSPGRELSFDQALRLALQRKLKSAELLEADSRLVGTGVLGIGASKPSRFWTSIPSSDATNNDLVKTLLSSGVRLSIEPQRTKRYLRLLLGALLPTLAGAFVLATLLSSDKRAKRALKKRGPARERKPVSSLEARRLAVHQAGHAVALAAFGKSGYAGELRLEVSCAPVGGHRFVMSQLVTATQFHQMMVELMAGAVAEEVILGEASTAADGDLQTAAGLARDGAGRYGLAAGFSRLPILGSEAYADASLGRHRDRQISEAGLQELEEQVRKISQAAERTAASILRDNLDLVEELAEALEKDKRIGGQVLQGLLSRTYEAPTSDIASQPDRAPLS